MSANPPIFRPNLPLNEQEDIKVEEVMAAIHKLRSLFHSNHLANQIISCMSKAEDMHAAFLQQVQTLAQTKIRTDIDI